MINLDGKIINCIEVKYTKYIIVYLYSAESLLENVYLHIAIFRIFFQMCMNTSYGFNLNICLVLSYSILLDFIPLFMCLI